MGMGVGVYSCTFLHPPFISVLMIVQFITQTVNELHVSFLARLISVNELCVSLTEPVYVRQVLYRECHTAGTPVMNIRC